MVKARDPRHERRVQDVDRFVGTRMRDRRVTLGLTQQQMAELIDVTYQQAHKYEKGINRVSAGRLYQLAKALKVDIGYFFDGLTATMPVEQPPQQRMLLELGRSFQKISSPTHRDALCRLASALAHPETDAEPVDG